MGACCTKDPSMKLAEEKGEQIIEPKGKNDEPIALENKKPLSDDNEFENYAKTIQSTSKIVNVTQFKTITYIGQFKILWSIFLQ